MGVATISAPHAEEAAFRRKKMLRSVVRNRCLVSETNFFHALKNTQLTKYLYTCTYNKCLILQTFRFNSFMSLYAGTMLTCHCPHVETWFSNAFRQISRLELLLNEMKTSQARLEAARSAHLLPVAGASNDASGLVNLLPCGTKDELEEFGRLLIETPGPRNIVVIIKL